MFDALTEINALKRERKAIILAHTYTFGEVQDVADFVGDSYGLSKKAANLSDVETIVFAGVRFMAETAAILAPDKKVLLPVENAGCPMADMITPKQLQEFKNQHPDAKVVCYVNSTVETKALSDVCVTSSNAVKIVKKLDADKILFIPDQNLGSYVAEQVPQKEIVLWNGFCPVHHAIKPQDVLEAKKRYPNAIVLMHPETPKETRKFADKMMSTGQMAEFVKEKKHKQYIIITERGIIHHLKSFDESAEFFEMPNKQMKCENMKKITLQDVFYALKENKHIVSVEKEIALKAKKSIEKMLELAE